MIPLSAWHPTYIKVVNEDGSADTYGILGERDKNGNGTSKNQQVMKNDDRNYGSCRQCTTTQEQRDRLVDELNYWASPANRLNCPSCGKDYRQFFLNDLTSAFDGYNSNTFTYNMLSQDPAGSIAPPAERAAPGYHNAPGQWYQ